MGSKVSESSDAGTGAVDRAALVQALQHDLLQRRRRPIFGRISARVIDRLATDEAAAEVMRDKMLADLRAGGKRAAYWLSLDERIAHRRKRRRRASPAMLRLRETVAIEEKAVRVLLQQIGLSAREAKSQLNSELADPLVLAAIQAREEATKALAESVRLLGAEAFPSPDAYASEVRKIATAWNAAVAHTELIAKVCPRCGAPAEDRHRKSNHCSQVCQSRDREKGRRASRKQKWATKPEPPTGRGQRRRGRGK